MPRFGQQTCQEALNLKALRFEGVPLHQALAERSFPLSSYTAFITRSARRARGTKQIEAVAEVQFRTEQMDESREVALEKVQVPEAICAKWEEKIGKK